MCLQTYLDKFMHFYRNAYLSETASLCSRDKLIFSLAFSEGLEGSEFTEVFLSCGLLTDSGFLSKFIVSEFATC